jgi:hypothetical protein
MRHDDDEVDTVRLGVSHAIPLPCSSWQSFLLQMLTELSLT